MKKMILIAVSAALVVASPAAAAPDNDDVADARALGALPARVAGTTSQASAEGDEPASTCGRTSGSVWYRLRADRRGPIVVQVEAAGELEAVVGVFRRTRTRLEPVACRRTNANGRALV